MLAISVDLDEMQHHAAFHQGLQGRPGQNDAWGKMKQRYFSNDDAIYDVSYSN